MSPDIRRIAVVYFSEGWRIVAGRHRWGCYAYRVDAEEAALRLVEKARAHGASIEVLVQDNRGELRPFIA
jgi:hypothetical protein